MRHDQVSSVAMVHRHHLHRLTGEQCFLNRTASCGDFDNRYDLVGRFAVLVGLNPSTRQLLQSLQVCICGRLGKFVLTACAQSDNHQHQTTDQKPLHHVNLHKGVTVLHPHIKKVYSRPPSA